LHITLEQYKKAQKFRLAVAKLLEQLPEAARSDPEVQFLAEEARVRIATLVQLKYQSSRYEPPRPSRLGDVKAVGSCLRRRRKARENGEIGRWSAVCAISLVGLAAILH